MAILLTFLPNSYREGLARGVRATVLRPVLALQQGAVERNTLFDDPARLRAERDSLAAFLVGNATLAAENRQLRDMLGLQERLPPSFVPAEVVRIPGRGSEGFFQITAGASRGVAPGASIVAAGGLVGRVRDVDDTIAFGIDWMHPEFRASAMTVDGETYGIVEPRRIGAEPLLALTGTPRHVELEPGALIVTSGHGGVFPRGIPIGTVLGAEGGEAEWQRNYLIQPMVGPSEMTYVLVLGEPQRTLEGLDLALVWGIRPVATRPEAEAGATLEGFTGGPAAGGTGAAGGGPAQTPAAETPAQTPPAETPAQTPPPQPAPEPQGPPLLGTPVPPQD
ncbi:MAG TPA: rod shape-determining protein MreC [Longimicrobiaceae bacterium]|nr:rod shape-determining protein MreC [Longimicrobiaceae bacterium]